MFKKKKENDMLLIRSWTTEKNINTSTPRLRLLDMPKKKNMILIKVNDLHDDAHLQNGC